ncbi:hypothetical protein [Conchiformibius kuhniae]|uniref:Periplasmic protein n=1 Tax=Conchiformibius kuhniae TaxID=211502 RepID=A0A8T9MTI9_9NEIS|nr:hypothetical protein [Conchiformibius kuhniae]
MKKPLFILTLAAAVSPVLDAKVYSCGPGCYSDKSKGSKGYANLGKQIGTYTAAKPKPALDNVAENQTAPVVPVQHAHGSRNRIARPVPVTVKRQAAPRPLPAVAVARPKANPAKSGGRRTILEQELANERSALAAAQKALADGRVVLSGKTDAGHQSRVRQLESAVLDRQQNIQALQRELSRM